LVPIVYRDGFQQMHEALARHNWLFFRESDNFDRGFEQLISAIDTDLAHVRLHTRLLERAIEWKKERRSQSFLLRGEDLERSHNWLVQAEQKEPKPTELQQEYISNSQASEEAQKVLKAVEHASQILADARRQTSYEVPKLRIRWTWIPKITLGMTVPILLIRMLGVLQGWEWKLLDQFFLLRPMESRDERITIIKIEESDITRFGSKVPDRVLAQALNIIKAAKPRVIGLNLYRGRTAETDLEQFFQSTPNFFGVEKSLGKRIAPPSTLKQLGQVGFSDIVLDIDGTVRRALLSMRLDNQVQTGLATQLALRYLETEKVIPEQSESGRVRLGKTIFDPLKPNDGGYVDGDTGGYQILLNYRGTQTNFFAFSLQQILNGQVPAEQLHDRVILIGTATEDVEDGINSPYSKYWFERIPKVVLQANMISQLLSAALDGRPLLRCWTKPLEGLWIVGWVGIGAVISWWFRSPIRLIVSAGLVSCGLIGGCYSAFLIGWWLPVLPALLGFLGGTIALSLVRNKQFDHLRFQHTLTLLLQARRDYPTAGQIAIEYLKQSETKENQVLIDRQLNQH
ncbi:CHASE2 domain-containing protein, partial [Cyanobacteria bacterium FACHB-63]|nr:CHASE2 domain-containing protein [Cyanobacteria bacterium FACHB-63]